MRINNTGFMVGMLTAGACVAVQAAPISLSPTLNYTANTTWQDIKGTSYSFGDLNSNNILEIGETVTFSVTMHKTAWGVHDYDALKVWIDQHPSNPPSSTLYTQNFIWDFDIDDSNMGSDRWWNPYTRRWEDVSYKPWTGGDRTFTFSYTFANAGYYDLTASVMCSADLSGLVGWANGTPTTSDWNAWNQTVHGPNGSRVFQGETERYQLKVHAPTPAVPEPSTMALFLISLTGMAGMRYLRRKK